MFALLVAHTLAAPCSLHWIPTQDHAVAVLIEEKQLPVHSILRSTAEACGEGQIFELQWVPSFSKALSQPQYALGERVCLSAQSAPLPEGLVAYAHLDVVDWDMKAGDVVDLESSKLCAISSKNAERISILKASDVETVQGLQAHWVSMWGEALKGGVELNPFGYVALPHAQILSLEEIAAADALEYLDTEKRKEKGIRAVGPDQAWLHFWGADSPYSDHWAPPKRIRAWVDLAASWQQHCLEQGLGTVTQCALKIGDIAWLNAKLPDPLGHKTHYLGACMDIRLFRNDQSTYEAYWNRADDRPQAVGGYSPSLTQAFVTFVHAHADVDVFYFNDPNITGVQASRGHDDHLHLCLK